jgi:hypothetical protein
MLEVPIFLHEYRYRFGIIGILRPGQGLIPTAKIYYGILDATFTNLTSLFSRKILDVPLGTPAVFLPHKNVISAKLTSNLPKLIIAIGITKE